MVLASKLTGTELGRVSGVNANDGFGSLPVDFNQTGANTYLIRAPAANNNAGSVVLASNVIGTEIGRVSGAAPGDGFGATDGNDQDVGLSSNRCKIMALRMNNGHRGVRVARPVWSFFLNQHHRHRLADDVASTNDDHMFGSPTGATLSGGLGNDTFIGGIGSTVFGGSGNDIVGTDSLGVVFGDIGTSPLYAFKEAFGGTHAVFKLVG